MIDLIEFKRWYQKKRTIKEKIMQELMEVDG
jgi:hypothetical protein